jgi:hypothetical protein
MSHKVLVTMMLQLETEGGATDKDLLAECVAFGDIINHTIEDLTEYTVEEIENAEIGEEIWRRL